MAEILIAAGADVEHNHGQCRPAAENGSTELLSLLNYIVSQSQSMSPALDLYIKSPHPGKRKGIVGILLQGGVTGSELDRPLID